MKNVFGMSIVLAVLVSLFTGCPDGTPEQVAAPTANPGAGAYAGTQTVTLATTTAGADIYYTTDGTTTPSASTGTLYSSAISVSMGTTLKAIAVKAGMTDSEVLEAAYIELSYTLVPIPAGTVTANIGNTGGPFINASTANVTVSAFKMGETEVTYELWYAVKEWAKTNKGYSFANEGREGHNGTVGAVPTSAKQEPVTWVSWRDTVVWCNAYSEAKGLTPYYYLEGTGDFTDGTKVLRESDTSTITAGNGKAEKAVSNASANGFRLPTEAQWEYAARGGVPSTGTPWTLTYAGTNTAGRNTGELGDYAWYNAYSGNASHAVKTKAANSAGLYDMSGNVWEWCWDIYSANSRVLRGGSWKYEAASCVVSNRNYASPGFRGDDTGFRVVCP
ncbi:hypothetical protein FACS189483_09500 [Spirochaetia bacterium]|nr:hypothetical protein FACS189483_09500 [Spirochaetia bacterium]